MMAKKNYQHPFHDVVHGEFSWCLHCERVSKTEDWVNNDGTVLIQTVMAVRLMYFLGMAIIGQEVSIPNIRKFQSLGNIIHCTKG